MYLKKVSRSSSQLNPRSLPIPSIREITISIPKKFDGTISKFRRFLKYLQFYLRFYFYQYFNGFTQVSICRFTFLWRVLSLGLYLGEKKIHIFL